MVLEQEAQRVGKMWSIPSKWTSYVAIDRTTSQHQRISVYKADAIKVPQLMRTRSPQDALDPAIRRPSGFRQPYARRTSWGERSFKRADARLLSTNDRVTNVISLSSPRPVPYKELRHLRKSHSYIPSAALDFPGELDSFTTASDATDADALEGILRLQKADGRFELAGSNFQRFPKQKYVGNVLKNFINSTFHQESSAMHDRISELTDTILTVVYITHTHAASEALWELQITKAREWIKRTITEWLKNDTSEVLVPDISLRELEESILEELKKQDSFLGQSHTSSD